MNVISTPVAAVRYGPSIDELHDRERHEADTRRHGERSADGERHEQQPDADEERDRREHRRAAGEREDAAPAAETSEHRERVADHRRTAADVGETPDAGVGERGPDERSNHTLRAVADEHRDRRPAPQCLAGVPEARVAVADLAQVDPGTAGSDEVGDRDRSDEIADHDRDCHLDAHR